MWTDSIFDTKTRLVTPLNAYPPPANSTRFMQFKNLHGLMCLKFVLCSLLNDCLHYLLLFRPWTFPNKCMGGQIDRQINKQTDVYLTL